jgi:DNA-directed RNA polymerase subunit H (RpoH/RPB5)
MMQRRGYRSVITRVDDMRVIDSNYTIIDFRDEFKNTMKSKEHFLNTLDCVYEGKKTNGEIEQVYVVYAIPRKNTKGDLSQFGKASADKIITDLADPNATSSYRHIIIMSEVSISSQGASELNFNRHVLFEFMTFDFMKIDRTANFLVPKHELLTLEQKGKIIRENGIDERKYARISVDDPQSRYYGATIGDMFLIYRNEISYNALVPNYRYYRIVEAIDLDLKTRARDRI